MKAFGLFLLAILLTGCVDAGGFTERTQIRANALVRIQQEKSAAVIAQARAEQAAREAEAQARLDEEIARQSGLNHRYATLAMFAPVLMGVAGLFMWGAMVIHWRGKIAYARATDPLYDPLPLTPALPPAVKAALAQRGCRGEFDGVNWWILENATGKRSLNPIPQRLLTGG